MANATQFNYRLSDGTIILADVNSSQAATVDVAPILSGKIASPVPQEILQRERDLQARGTQATTFNPNTSVAERGTIDTSKGITTSQAGIKTDPAIFATPENVKNALATPQQIAEQMKNPNWNAGTSPITPQSIEEGIKNLSAIPSTGVPTGQNVQTFTTPSGLKVDAPTTLAPGLAGKSGIITTESSRGETPLGIASSTSTTSMADATVAGADTTAKSIQDYIKLLTPADSETSDSVKSLIASITTDLEGLKGRGATQLSEEQAQGVEAKKQLLQNAQTELGQKLAEYKSIQAKYQQLNTNVEGKAITMGSIVGSQAQVNRAMQSELNVKSSEIAMIQANVAGAQGNLKLAQDSADRAVDLKYSDAKDAIDVRLKQLELMEGQLTKEEKIRSDAINMYLSDQKTKLATQVANEKDKNATLLNWMNDYRDAGITLGDTIQSANQKITTKSAIYKKEAGGGGEGVSVSGLTPEQQKDPFIIKMLNSKGGKPITDTFAQSLNKGLAVLGQIGGLQTNIKDMKTGPLVGLFQGANPWDTNAQTIKAQLNAIVPNLARGVYGEVGVLTDNDIKQYAKTLPNLKSTEDIRNAVLGITVDLIGKSIKRTLEINAANRKDVSGFVDLYTEMNNTKDSIFQQIPGYKGSTKSFESLGITKEEESLFNTTIGSTTQTTEQTGGFFSNIWKGLFGK